MTNHKYALKHLGAILLLTAIVPLCSAQTEPKTLKNVRGMDAAKLVGSECRGTFAVPDSQSATGMGAFRFEFTEQDGSLAANLSSQWGAEAFKNAMAPDVKLGTRSTQSRLEAIDNKMTYVSASGTKWEFDVAGDGSLVGTVDPRAVPGRQSWSVANLVGRCSAVMSAAK